LKKTFYKIKQSKNLKKWQNLIEMALSDKLNFSNSYNYIDNNYIMSNLQRENANSITESPGTNLEQLLELQKNRIKDINLINSPSKKIKDKRLNLTLQKEYGGKADSSRIDNSTEKDKNKKSENNKEKIREIEKNKQKKIKKVNFNLKNLPGDVRRNSCGINQNVGFMNNLIYDKSYENENNMYNNPMNYHQIHNKPESNHTTAYKTDGSQMNSKINEENFSNNMNMMSNSLSSEHQTPMNNMDPYQQFSPFIPNNINPYQQNISNQSFQGNRKFSNHYFNQNNISNNDIQKNNCINSPQTLDNNYFLNRSNGPIYNKNLYQNNQNNNNNSFNQNQSMGNNINQQNMMFSNIHNNQRLQQNMNNSNTYSPYINNSNSNHYNNSFGFNNNDPQNNIMFPHNYGTPEVKTKPMPNFNATGNEYNMPQNPNTKSTFHQGNNMQNMPINNTQGNNMPINYTQGNNMQVNNNNMYLNHKNDSFNQGNSVQPQMYNNYTNTDMMNKENQQVYNHSNIINSNSENNYNKSNQNNFVTQNFNQNSPYNNTNNNATTNQINNNNAI
jgi:hypothetical protein